MTTHLTNLFTAHIPQEAVAVQGTSYEDAVLDQLKHEFSLIVFTCVQLASKLSLYTNVSHIKVLYMGQQPHFI